MAKGVESMFRGSRVISSKEEESRKLVQRASALLRSRGKNRMYSSVEQRSFERSMTRAAFRGRSV